MGLFNWLFGIKVLEPAKKKTAGPESTAPPRVDDAARAPAAEKKSAASGASGPGDSISVSGGKSTTAATSFPTVSTDTGGGSWQFPSSGPHKEAQPAPATPPSAAPRRPPIEGPPEFVRAVELHRDYWTYDDREQWLLESRGIDQLSWHDRLRLHHLTCMERLGGKERGLATEKCKSTTQRLLAADSPYRPRPAMIWRTQATPTANKKPPDMQGLLLNASLSHLGALEVYRVDENNQPAAIDFVGFDELTGIVFAPAKIIRSVKLMYEDGRTEVVLTPLLYGPTWEIGSDVDRAGRVTRFVAYLENAELSALGAAGVGVGQQDFALRSPDGSVSLFGIGNVDEIAFPLDMRDPGFDKKARARGMDPEAIRRQIAR